MPQKTTKKKDLVSYKTQWAALLVPRRYGKEYDISKINPARSPFIQDYDRLIFSDSFRRLSGKTQVHPLSTNDHIHTRLSHSLEVSSVGRGLGSRLGYFLKERNDLPFFIRPEHIGEIVSCACIAHDIGNPPFGHAGEKAIQDWFKADCNRLFTEDLNPHELADFSNFDGNAQGFRLINVLENDRSSGGFCLTYPTIATIVKYPNNSITSEKNRTYKFNYYASEELFFKKVFFELGLYSGKVVRHPLSYLMEAADDTCYRIIDMEDARELGIISYEQILEAIAPIWKLIDIDEKRLASMHSDRSRMSYVRSKVIGVVSDGVFDAYVAHYDRIMGTIKKGESIEPLIDLTSKEIQKYMGNAKEIFKKNIMNDKKKNALEIGSYGVYKHLLDAFIPALYRKCTRQKLAYNEERAIAILGDHITKIDVLYDAYLEAIDFISGMTDSYATFLSLQFAGNGNRYAL